jgi:hypothetical protein
MAFHLILDGKEKLVEIQALIPIDLHADLKTHKNLRRNIKTEHHDKRQNA